MDNAVRKKVVFFWKSETDIKVGLNTFNVEDKSYPVYPLMCKPFNSN